MTEPRLLRGAPVAKRIRAEAAAGVRVIESTAGVTPALCAALLAAGVLGALIGILQVFWPQWTDGEWIARVGNGRAAGNLRQPNHLSSLLLWSLVALAWLAEPQCKKILIHTVTSVISCICLA